MSLFKRITAIGILLTALAIPALADEAPFGFVHTTDLEPQGASELEQAVTYRWQKVSGYFNLLVGQTELEYGVFDNFQVGLEATYDWTNAYHNGPFAQTAPPEPFVYDTPGPDDQYESTRFISLSLDMVYRMLSPYTDGLGLAFNFEPESSLNLDPGAVVEPSARIILQKNFLDDTLTCAFNFTYAPELRHLPANYAGIPGSDTWNEETDVNYYLAASYRFMPDLSAGFEFLNEFEYISSYVFTNEANCGYYFGPTIHYANETFFVTATFVTQLPWAGWHEDTVPGAVVDGYVFDNDFEKYRFKLIFGINI